MNQLLATLPEERPMPTPPDVKAMIDAEFADLARVTRVERRYVWYVNRKTRKAMGTVPWLMWKLLRIEFDFGPWY